MTPAEVLALAEHAAACEVTLALGAVLTLGGLALVVYALVWVARDTREGRQP